MAYDVRREGPAITVLAVVALGLAVVALGSWRYGAWIVGLALLLAGGLRLTLPARTAGLLVVRTRTFDSALLLVLGFVVVLLANTIPQG